MIVVDTSALIAIATDEPGSKAIDDVLMSESAIVSAGTLAEAFIVAGQRGVRAELESLIVRVGFEVADVTAEQARQIGAAYARWGRGNHPAGLNYGDCFAYTLAMERDSALLFVGNDFSRTDVVSAL